MDAGNVLDLPAFIRVVGWLAAASRAVPAFQSSAEWPEMSSAKGLGPAFKLTEG